MPRRRPPAVGLLLGLLATTMVACRPAARPRDGGDACVFGKVVGGVTEPSAAEVVIPVRKRAWTAARGGERAARPFIRARLVSWPSSDTIRRPPDDDRGLAWALARDTWRGLDALADREHRLPIDHVRLAPLEPATPPVGDYTNVTNDRPAPGRDRRRRVELGLLPRDEPSRAPAPRRSTRSSGSRRTRGFFFNYYDTTTLERTSNFVSFVDSAWLTAGLMVVRQALPRAGRARDALDRRAATTRFFYDAGARPHVARLLRAPRSAARATTTACSTPRRGSAA